MPLRSIIALCLFYSIVCIKSDAQGLLSPKLLIKSIEIEGNKRTRKDIFLRELPFKEGDSIYEKDLSGFLEIAQKQLTNLALFHEIRIDTSGSATCVTVYIHVRERWYIFPDPTNFALFPDFNQWWKTKELYRITYGLNIYDLNFRGNNERLTLNLIGGWRQAIGFQYKISNLNKAKTIGLQVSTLYQLGHEVPYSTQNDQLQYIRVDGNYIFHKNTSEVQLSYRRHLKTTHLFTLGMDYYNVNDTVTMRSNMDYLHTGTTTLRAFYASYRITYQDLDYFFYPLKGIFFSAAAEKRGMKFFKDDADFANFYFDLEKYTPLFKNLFLANSFKIQQSSDKTIPYIYSNSLGYRDLVRGYDLNIINGSAYYLFNNELKTKIFDHSIHLPLNLPSQFNPIPMKLYLKVFYDAGYVVSLSNSMNQNRLPNHALQGYGAGMDIVSYYDKILRIEYSFNNLGQRALFLHYIVAF